MQGELYSFVGQTIFPVVANDGSKTGEYVSFPVECLSIEEAERFDLSRKIQRTLAEFYAEQSMLNAEARRN